MGMAHWPSPDIAGQSGTGRLMEWDEPRLAELRVPDEQHPALEIDVRPLEPQRSAGTKPRRREQANERRIRGGSQSVRGRQSTGCRDQIRDFLTGKDVRLHPAPLAGQDPCRWDLRARVVRTQPGRESPDLTESAGPRGALHTDWGHRPAQPQVSGNERGA